MIQNLAHLDPPQQDGVLSLISAATEHDGIPPIAEHIVLHLRHGGDKADRHLIIEEGGQIIGYAHIDLTDAVAGSSARMAEGCKDTPVDNAIIGIVDDVSLD